jgi:hypothetical protein
LTARRGKKDKTAASPAACAKLYRLAFRNGWSSVSKRHLCGEQRRRLCPTNVRHLRLFSQRFDQFFDQQTRKTTVCVLLETCCNMMTMLLMKNH